jgi:hypothetical protein
MYMATVIFWTALALLVYVGYPLGWRLATRFRRPTRYDDAYQPTRCDFGSHLADSKARSQKQTLG